MAFIVKGGINHISKKDMKKLIENDFKKTDGLEGLSEEKKNEINT